MKHIPLKYLGEQGDASALAILKSFDPEWKSGSFGIKRLSEDNVNTVRPRPLLSYRWELTTIVCAVAQIREICTWVRDIEVFPSASSGVPR